MFSSTKSKGQISTADIFIAMLLFFIVVVLSTQAWDSFVNSINEYESRSAMLAQANNVLSLLTSQPGIPTNWSTNSVILVGLSSQLSIIDPQKFSQLVSMNYTKLQDQLGMQGLDFVIKLTDKNGDLINKIGTTPPAPTAAAVAQTMVGFQNDIGVLYVIIWKS